MERLPTAVWVDALIRRAEVAGAAAFILQKGDESRGSTLVKVARMDGTAHVYTPGMTMEGDRNFVDLTVQGVGPDEGEVDAYIQRTMMRDTDTWVIEIEDKSGRHFLTEPIEGDADTAKEKPEDIFGGRLW